MATIKKRKKIVVRNPKSSNAKNNGINAATISTSRKHLSMQKTKQHSKLYSKRAMLAKKKRLNATNIKAHKTHRAHITHRKLQNKHAIAKRRVKRIFLQHSVEELLEDRVFSHNVNMLNAPLVHDILYSTTPALRNLAYKSGFSFGRELYAKSDGTINKLLETLEYAGLSRVLYYPFDDKIIITAMPNEKHSTGSGMHVYESGVIAGYLSASSKKIVNAFETKCSTGNSPYCQFIAKPEGMFRIDSAYGNYDLKSIVSALADSIYNSNGAKVAEEYLMLSMLPLTKEPIAKEISKLFYLAGLKIRSEHGSNKEVLEKIAAQLGLKINADAHKGSTESVKLHFDEINSVKGFVDISSALFAGAANNDREQGIELSQRLDKRHMYMVKLSPVK
jgi:predicted hydrocarbon binding protein